MQRLDPKTAPLVIAFGHKAQMGKSECADAIYEAYKDQYAILRTSFADALRQEVQDAIDNRESGLGVQDAVKELCLLIGADYDPEPVVDARYPYGKQRDLLQKWGTEFRRTENPFYWIHKLEKRIIDWTPQVVLIDDLRFPNEFFWVHHLSGKTVHVERPGRRIKASVGLHASERALDGYEFDYELTSVEGQTQTLRESAVALFDIIYKRWSGAECAALLGSIPDLVGQEI